MTPTSPACAFVASTALGLLAAACASQEGAASRTGEIREAMSSSDLFGGSLPPKTLALTFDDGPGPRTGELSTYLRQQGIRATFFVNGGRVAPTALPGGLAQTPNAAAILAQLASDGHLIANHTTTHRDLVGAVLPTGAWAVAQELGETDADIAPYIPSGHLLFRPPFGSYSGAVFNALSGTPMSKYVGPVNWDIGGSSNRYPSAAADWACWQGQLATSSGAPVNGDGYATTAQCGDAYLAEIARVGRGIVLLHDPYAWASGSTVDMIAYVVPVLKAQGYAFARVDEVPAIAALLPLGACHPSCATCSGSGSNQCTTCYVGAYVSAGSCHPCSGCGAGTFQVAACTATTDAACAACRVCGDRTFTSSACASGADAQCTACHPTCAGCTGPGAADCASCAAGSYLAAGSCHACGTCGAGTYEASACTFAADTACRPCDPGCTTCDGPGKDRCTACPTREFSAGGVCHPCSVCSAGTIPAAACTATRDAVCAPCPAGTASQVGSPACTPCAPGTFAPDPGAAACLPCAAGSHATTAGAAACAPCGSCEDGDPCTVDACDPALGCVHSRAPGCAAGPGASPPASDAPTDAPTDANAVSRAGVATSAPDGGSSGAEAVDHGCAVAPALPASGGGRGGDRGRLAFALVALGLGLAARRRSAPRRSPARR
jgi:peptidoglycan/xylan/chitin deacetylase (PgdA/CDA1 family)